MRLSGIDPGIIRELSGIYKPFIKAFKELVSNAFDADAKRIEVVLSDDFSCLDLVDDGHGMTPYEFHQDFARLGGSTAWLRDGKTPNGRARIGYKGIGFLAVARYCSALHVETYSKRPFKSERVLLRGKRNAFSIQEIIGETVTVGELKGRITITAVKIHDGSSKPLKERRDYRVTAEAVHLTSARTKAATQVEFSFEINCSHLKLEASLNFDYLLGLERKADLRLLEDFCTIKLSPADPQSKPGTRVRLHKLKDFAVRELSAPAVKGKARNVVFKSGKEQFLWRLSRAAPIRDDISADIESEPIRRVVKIQSRADLPDLVVRWRSEEPVTLRRPVYLAKGQATPLEESIIPVDIDEGGLRVVGYILARSEVIYPGELRGLSVRVRNVAIGDSSFLGWEQHLSGPRKAAMSQISGELMVLSGLEASDAINPGRESFYEENPQYRILKNTLFGSEESIGGLVGKAIHFILDRIHVRSQVTEKLAEAKQRRRTLTDISSAVNYYARSTSSVGLQDFFETPLRANGLASARDVVLRPGHKLGGFEVEEGKRLSDDVEIDFNTRKVRLDYDQDTWSNTVYLNGHYYEVSIKQGKADHPICEFDNEKKRIYVNWGHPVKMNMDDAAFLKSAILLRLAYHAAPHDANAMMDLALNMLSFRAE